MSAELVASNALLRQELERLTEQQKITNQLLFLPAIKAMGMDLTVTDAEGLETVVTSWMEKIEWAAELD